MCGVKEALVRQPSSMSSTTILKRRPTTTRCNSASSKLEHTSQNIHVWCICLFFSGSGPFVCVALLDCLHKIISMIKWWCFIGSIFRMICRTNNIKLQKSCFSNSWKMLLFLYSQTKSNMCRCSRVLVETEDMLLKK